MLALFLTYILFLTQPGGQALPLCLCFLLFVLYCRQPQSERGRDRGWKERERDEGVEVEDRKRWREGEVERRGSGGVSSNTSCHLILLKGQQLEIKTKFEINEAHSGGGIRF